MMRPLLFGLLLSMPPACPPCQDFHLMNQQVLAGTLNVKEEAAAAFHSSITRLSGYCSGQTVHFSKHQWVFPLKGYTIKSVGGTNGNGYLAQSYNYFDGNKHTGHPAHDIFIYDKDQNCLDDRTGKPVQVVSVSGGLVIATEQNWESGSKSRGGKYVWIYDFTNQYLFYYAHNSHILVKPGDFVKPGDTIALVGRTGLNAAPARSPTHLHLMVLDVRNKTPEPYNFYPDLR